MSTPTATSDAASSPAAALSDNRWPLQSLFILWNEAAERFSYYGMKGILAIYITTVLMKTQDQATNIIHLFGFANYFMPLLGAWVSDRYWGRYHTILWISLSYCVGHGVLACSDMLATTDAKVMCLYIGLALIAFGSGGIKPCVSAFMGDQFKPEQKHLLQKAYAAFYFSINFGSTAAFLIVPWVRDTGGYGWAFGVPGIAMGIATLIFYLGTPHYTRVPPSSKSKTAGFFKVMWFAIQGRSKRTPGQGFWDAARQRFSDAEVDAARSVLPILSIFSLVPIFWSLFDQTFSTWVLQGARMEPYLLGNYKIGPEQMLAANPILVIIFVPIMTLGLYPLLGRFASPLRRMSYGMFLAALSFVIVALIQVKIDSGARVSVMWQVVPYIVLTMSEVLVSTTGLEFAFREAAPSMKSTIMGFWYLTVAFGNLFVSVITKIAAGVLGGGKAGDVSVSPTMFYFYAGLTFVIAILFSVVAAFYKYRDASAAQGK
jgi:POT family proton-dependent oligopeptide transporter